MPNVYQPYLIQIRPQYIDAGDNTPENILWFIGSVHTGYTSDQLYAIQGAFDEGWGPVWKCVGATGTYYNSCVVTDWTSNAGLEIPLNHANAQEGTEDAPMGVNTAALISKEIGLRWRGGHPRTYLPSLAYNVTANGATLQGAVVTALVTAYTAFLGTMGSVTTDNGGPIIEQVYRNRNSETEAHLYNIEAYIVQAELASQRRRLRRVSRK